MSNAPKNNEKIHHQDWDSADWTVLVDAIHDEHCILMLGPDVAIPEGDDKPLGCQLANEMAVLLEDILSPIEYSKINPDNLPQVSQLYAKKKGQNYPKSMARDFYKDKVGVTSQLHMNLAALPFRTIITSTHDDMFLSALEKQNKEKMWDYYNLYGNYEALVEEGSIEKPLVFYLCGHIDLHRSLVLSENDLLDFLERVIKRQPALPGNILTMFSDSNYSFLFIGFGFRNWYLRILMHVLEDSKKNPSFALENVYPDRVRDFQSTVLFFKHSRHNIQIYDSDLNSFSEELNNQYFDRYPEISGENDTPDPRRPADPNAPVVFISHVRENQDIAKKIYAHLLSEGINPWLDIEEIFGGERFAEKIEKAIEKDITHFLFLNTKDYHNRLQNWARKEIKIALERQDLMPEDVVFTIPVKGDETALPDKLKDFDQIDFNKSDALSQICKTIKRDQERRRKKYR